MTKKPEDALKITTATKKATKKWILNK
jgi:hypothetical protein